MQTNTLKIMIELILAIFIGIPLLFLVILLIKLVISAFAYMITFILGSIGKLIWALIVIAFIYYMIFC